jgi:hypothetical protein
MVSRTVQGCEELMTALAKANFTNQVTLTELTKVITVKRGGDPRTVKNWLRNLSLLGYVKRQSINVFKLDFSRCPEALGLLVKSGQKKLL